MPLYEVHHYISLSPSQKDSLASIITDAHANNTGALRLFVNVIFKDTSSDPFQYIGGKRRPSNRIIAMTRSRGDAGISVLDDVVREIQDGWNKIVGTEGDRELGAIFMTDGLKAGMEKGFLLPKVSTEDAHLSANKSGQ